MSTLTATRVASIRHAQIHDANTIRELILQMLEDSPEAFGETLAEAQSRTDTDWQRYVEDIIQPPHHSAFI